MLLLSLNIDHMSRIWTSLIWLWLFGFRLKPNNTIALASSKDITRLKSSQKWLKMIIYLLKSESVTYSLYFSGDANFEYSGLQHLCFNHPLRWRWSSLGQYWKMDLLHDSSKIKENIKLLPKCAMVYFSGPTFYLTKFWLLLK